MTEPICGGCLCGAVRYRVTGTPVLSLFCFCRDCLAAGGADGYPGMMVRTEAFEHTGGSTTTHRRSAASGRSVTRHFCPQCGSNLWGVTELGLVSVAAGTLDDPDVFVPTKAVFTEDAPGWARIPAHLERD